MNEIIVQAIKFGYWHVLLRIFTLCISIFHIREIIFRVLPMALLLFQSK